MIPYGVSNYLLGVTQVRFWQFALGSCTYVMKLIIHCYIGCMIYKMEFQKAKGKKENTVNNALVVAEIVLVVAATIVISLYVRKILDEKIQ